MQQIKQPAETIIFEFDFAASLGTVTGTPTVTAAPSGLTIGTAQISAGLVRVTIAGGTAGVAYVLTATAANSVSGATAEIDADLLVAQLGATLPAGVTSSYMTGAEYVTRFGLEETVQLTDVHRSGTVNADTLTTALSDATEIANGYLAGLYAIPLAPAPGIVKQIVADLARERLHNDNPTAAVSARADTARTMLKDIAKAVISLPVTPAAAPAYTGGAGVAFTAPDRIFAGAGLP
jgi:phage gp36-like protein